jgi:anti-anti-sigma factor
MSRRPEADSAGNVVVAPRGALDGRTVSALCTMLHEALSRRPETITLDLGLVTSLDRSGFSYLVSELREVRSLGVGIAVSGALVPNVQRMVELAMLVSVVAPPHSE